jgi:L-ascorbate metabolism protein UlaG (beta-lactamase superfamily)
MPDGISVTWYGHATWGLAGPDGTTVLLDPWVTGPTAPKGLLETLQADVIALTHGHGDHTGDVLELAARLQVPVLAPTEIGDALEQAGVADATGFGKGGTVEKGGVRFTMTEASHSGAVQLGGKVVGYCEPAGYVITFANGTRVYAAGDTAIFSEMALIRELYAPSIAILPIGGHYTMDPFQAAHACRLLGVSHVFPGHYGTFPVLVGTPAELRSELADLGLADRVQVHELEPGGTLG